jgi:hypothetical protein
MSGYFVALSRTLTLPDVTPPGLRPDSPLRGRDCLRLSLLALRRFERASRRERYCVFWEYKTVTFALSSRWSAKGQEQERDKLRRMLDDHGDEGWRLQQYTAIPVATGSKVESYQHTLIFERQAEQVSSDVRRENLDRYMADLDTEYFRLDDTQAVYQTGSMSKQGHLVAARSSGEIKEYAISIDLARRWMREAQANEVVTTDDESDL